MRSCARPWRWAGFTALRNRVILFTLWTCSFWQLWGTQVRFHFVSFFLYFCSNFLFFIFIFSFFVFLFLLIFTLIFPPPFLSLFLSLFVSFSFNFLLVMAVLCDFIAVISTISDCCNLYRYIEPDSKISLSAIGRPESNWNFNIH